MGNEPARQKGSEGDAPIHLDLWVAALTPPIAWAIQFLIIYGLVTHVQKVGTQRSLHITSAIFILIGLACGALAWRNIGKADKAVIDEERESILFLARLGMLSAAMFTLVMIAQVIPTFYIDPSWE